MEQDDQEKNNADIKRNSMIAVVVCILFLVAYFFFEQQQFIIDNNVLIFVFAGLGFLFIPGLTRLVKRIRVSLLEIELTSVASRTFSGEVVQDDETGKFYYIAKDKTLFTLPDVETANILKSYKGFLSISKGKLKEFGILYELESAKKADILRSEKHGDVYIILNKKKYYVSSYSPIRDMGRMSDIRDVAEEEIDKYETGR